MRRTTGSPTRTGGLQSILLLGRSLGLGEWSLPHLSASESELKQAVHLPENFPAKSRNTLSPGTEVPYRRRQNFDIKIFNLLFESGNFKQKNFF